MRASERASDIESGGSDGREEGELGWGKAAQATSLLFFHIADERNSDV